MAWIEIMCAKYRRDGLRYASNTTDEEWAVIEPHLPPPADLRAKRCDLPASLCKLCINICNLCYSGFLASRCCRPAPMQPSSTRNAAHPTTCDRCSAATTGRAM
jgi:hypothetical protein